MDADARSDPAEISIQRDVLDVRIKDLGRLLFDTRYH